MEHIVNFGISIDDDKIEKVITQQASNHVLDEINKKVYAFANKNWNNDSELKQLFREEVKKVVDENKESIIAEVTKIVANNLTKTKAIKDLKNAFE